MLRFIGFRANVPIRHLKSINIAGLHSASPLDYSLWLSRHRLTINQTFRDLADNKAFQDEAEKRSLDKPVWKAYVNTFRREIFNKPNTIDNVETKNQFVQAIENIHITSGLHHDSAEYHQQIAAEKKSLFSIIISKAEIDLRELINTSNLLTSTSDLRVPHDWYPVTRLTKRKIIYHGGPTNSGKVSHHYRHHTC